MNTRRRRRADGTPAIEDAVSFSASAVRLDCRAGRSPTTNAVTKVAASAKASTGRSSRTSSSRGMDAGAAATTTRAMPAASAMPATPPAAAIAPVSLSICADSRDRDAPSAVRMASSRARAVSRTSRRLATLAHATSRTSATAPNRTSSVGRALPATRSPSGVRPACRCSSWLTAVAMVATSVAARASVVPGRRRPIGVKPPPLGFAKVGFAPGVASNQRSVRAAGS